MTPATMTTILGILCAVLGIAALPSPEGVAFLASSLVLDVADGYIARRFNCETELGRLLDWWSDVVIANAISIWLVLHGDPLTGTVALCGITGSLAATCAFQSYGIRTSGRALATALLVVSLYAVAL